MLQKIFLILSLLSYVAVAGTNTSSLQVVHGVIINHKEAYKPKPERGPHIDIKVTPPEKRGRENFVLVEVYNRTTVHLATVLFDITLLNKGGYKVTSSVEASDLKPNLSGAQWVKVGGDTKNLPVTLEATVTGVKAITVDAKEVNYKVFVDLIKE